jgi:hypothetical protein
MPDDDYDAIEAAVMDTARGRWFLAEFARRNRTADTSLLLTAIERLENMLERGSTDAPTPHEPVTTRAITSSAASELFAVEVAIEARVEPLRIPSAGLPDDGYTTWVIEEPPSTEALRTKPDTIEPEDEHLFWDGDTPLPPLLPVEEDEVPLVPSAQFSPLSFPAVTEKPVAPLQSAMLAAALAQAEETMARAAEPEPPPAPMGYSPGAVDPSELDALSYEEKSVFFA